MSSIVEVLANIIKIIFCGGGTQQEEKPQQQYVSQPQQGQYPPQPQLAPHKPPQQRPQQQQQRPPKRHRPQDAHNQNLINQKNSYYTSLRDQAHNEGDQMGRCFDMAHKAHEQGDGKRAKELSEEGHQHQREMERLNREASEWIFKENNLDSHPGEIDLHGLYVKEAIDYTDKAVQEAQGRGDSEIHLIVGKGLHSTNHVAKIKPAIEELMEKHSLSAHLDPNNAGVLIVKLTGEEGGLSVDEMTRQLGKEEDGCIVM